MSAYLIKVRQRGTKQFRFVTSKGGTTRLRIHAGRYEDREGETAKDRVTLAVAGLAALNPDLEFKAVRA